MICDIPRRKSSPPGILPINCSRFEGREQELGTVPRELGLDLKREGKGKERFPACPLRHPGQDPSAAFQDPAPQPHEGQGRPLGGTALSQEGGPVPEELPVLAETAGIGGDAEGAEPVQKTMSHGGRAVDQADIGGVF